jgi:hypothetical protein
VRVGSKKRGKRRVMDGKYDAREYRKDEIWKDRSGG